jgi:meiotic recombination protein DMC1
MKSNQIQIESEAEAMDEDTEFTINEIEKLQEFGINVADINKLKTSGFCTVSSILMATKKELLNIKGITEQKIEKIQEAAMKLEQGGFTTGYGIMLKRKNVLRITTGSKKLDQLLGGGIESMAITEVFGEFRTGKTQLCHTLSVTAQLPKTEGGGGGKVIFIDAEGTFRPERVIKIAERFGLDPEQVLNNIIYARVYTSEFQANIITLAAAKMMEDTFSLLIIDSIMALFRVDFSGRGELSERQQVLGKTLSKLIKLAEQFNVAVLLTNQVMSDPGATMTFTADPKKPIGGNILAHASTTRLYFRKGKGDERVCKIYDSPCLPESETVFRISDDGIDDAAD